MIDDHAKIKRDGYTIPLIGIEKYGTLTECSECQDDFGFLNYHDGANYILLIDNSKFICKNCLDKIEKYKNL